jgi:hypothetical protein
MREIAASAGTTFALLALLLSGCGAPSASPAPEVIEPNYENASLGLAMWYPEDWWHEGDGEQVTFAPSEEILRVEHKSGALMAVGRFSLEGQSLEEWYEDQDPLQSSDGWQFGDPTPRTIGDQRGFIVTFEGTDPYLGPPTRGFLAAAEYEGWRYAFFAMSMLDNWSEYGPEMEIMLDSVGFMEQE